MIQVIAKAKWEYVAGSTMKGCVYDGFVSKCALNGIIFYVRERLDVSDRFYYGSGVGVAEKEGRPCGGVQVLDLCAFPRLWDRIAVIVQQEDALHRPVRHHRNFTVQWAERHLTPTRPEAVTSPQP